MEMLKKLTLRPQVLAQFTRKILTTVKILMCSRDPDLRLYYSFHSEQNNFIYKALNKKKKIKLAFITVT